MPPISPLPWNGQPRRFYILWQEFIAPLIILEFVFGNGAEERNNTRWAGKLWIYEPLIRPAFYGIHEVEKASIEVYPHVENRVEQLSANAEVTGFSCTASQRTSVATLIRIKRKL